MSEIRKKVIIVLIAAALFQGCNERGSSNKDAENQAAQRETFTVTTAKAVGRNVPSTIQGNGNLVANESSDVAPRSAGKIVNIMVNVGDLVQNGAVIAKIDDKDARLQLNSANVGVKQAEASVKQAEARLGLLNGGRFDSSSVPEVREANANYEQALAEQRQAEANEKRYRELTETGDVAMMTYEQYRTSRDTARAKANAAKQSLEATVNTAKQSNQAIATARAAVEAAKAQVANAQQAVADTVVKAPYAGYISNRPVAVGEFVSTASVIATVLRTNPIKVQIQVNEADIPYVAIGRGVSLSVEAYKDRKFSGTVSAINPAVETGSRSAMIEALIDNADNALRAGMFATVQITREGGMVGVFIPKSAVYKDDSTENYRVYVIIDGIAKQSVVKLGTEEADFYQVLEGVAADETVATSNLDKLYEGANVSY